MSKKSKTKSKERNKREKATRKAAQRARYEGYMSAGRNTKSKRNRIGSKKKARSVNAVNHSDGRCGNAGCTKCFGFHFKSFLHKGQPQGMPHRMWLRWKELTPEARKKAA